MNSPEKYLFVLGSHPSLSVAEVISYFKKNGKKIELSENFLPKALMVSTTDEIDCNKIMANLGGVPVIEKVIAETNAINIEEILKLLDFSKRKIKNLGISWFSFSGTVPNSQIRKFGMELKRKIKTPGLRVVFPSRRGELSSAELFNNNFQENGVAIHIYETKNGVCVSTAEAVQDIEFYTSRDRLRPKVDPGSGMMPVKLSQMMVNYSETPEKGIIYDPFCGTGTILMEALLMGYQILGSDVSKKQVERTKENLKWLREEFPEDVKLSNEAKIFTANVNVLSYEITQNSLDAIVTEGWLGPALTNAPSPKDVTQIFDKVAEVISKMLANVKQPLKSGGNVVITLPAFKVGKRVIRFDAKKRLTTKGYIFDRLLPENLEHPIFRDSASGTLLYGRPDAIVLRDIIRLKKVG